VRLLDPRPGEDIIDMCAAPGGKTTYIAERMLGEGTIKAFEISEPRAAKLASNIERLSIKSCDIIRDDAIAEADGTADGVLVDAPCTGTGTLGRRADSRWKFDLDARERVRSDIEELKRMHPRQIFARQVERQLRFLLKAATLVDAGGRIVYSTCSMEPEENEQVVTRFLNKRPDFALEDAADFVPPMFVDGGFVRVLPHKHAIDGAFAARLVRSGREPLVMEAEKSTELAMETKEVA
jgi:16S rRNA (cytosine967-C5)-methyltransferase